MPQIVPNTGSRIPNQWLFVRTFLPLLLLFIIVHGDRTRSREMVGTQKQKSSRSVSLTATVPLNHPDYTPTKTCTRNKTYATTFSPSCTAIHTIPYVPIQQLELKPHRDCRLLFPLAFEHLPPPQPEMQKHCCLPSSKGIYAGVGRCRL